MSQRVSSAGMFLCYTTGEVGDVTPPTEAEYKVVPEVKSMPSFNPAPETIDSTTLLETVYRTYVPGLKDLGGALEYGANMTDDLVTFWDTLCKAYDTAAAEGKPIWFAVVHKKLDQATFFQGEPSPIGLNEASVGSMAETTLYVTPVSAPQMGKRPKIDAESKKLPSLSDYTDGQGA